MEYRPFYLAREWVRTGHEVRIVAAAYSHVRRKQPSIDGVCIRQRHIEYIDGIEYAWYPTPQYRGNGVGRAVNILAFLRQVWADAKRIADEFRPDFVIASSTYPLDIWIAKRLVRISRSKLIFEVHDLWPLSPIELGGMSPRNPFIRLCQWAENTAYRDADTVISMLPKIHNYMAEQGLDLSKLYIVPNGISPDDWDDNAQPLSADFATYFLSAHDSGHMIVGYAGAHGRPNALGTLLDAAKLLKGKPFRFVLVGDGNEKAHLCFRVANEGLNNVKMFSATPKTQIPALLHEFDVAYIGLRNQPLFRFGVSPNKLIDYMMAAKPIMFAINAGNDPVTEAACGLSLPPESPQAIADALLKLASMSYAERKAMGLRGQAYAQAHHAYPVLARNFLSYIKGEA
jgi:glycosyltransferase involved in cell wall biosynthesis